MMSLLLMALTVVPINDPLAPLQLLRADVTAYGGGMRVCVTVRNESPQTIDSVFISGTIHDESPYVSVFMGGVPTTTGKNPGLAPGDEFKSCASIPGPILRRGAIVQVTVK